MLVVLETMVVMLKTAITYLAPCQFTEMWRMQPQELALHLSCYCCGFLCLPQQVFAYSVFIFLRYFFWIHGHPPHIRNIAWCECPTDYHISTNWICAGISFVFLIFTYKIFFLSMLCCECEASIIKSGLLSHLNNERVMIRSLYSPKKVTKEKPDIRFEVCWKSFGFISCQ